MAADLADTPVAGLEAQLCGDAHSSNFGLFASPLRILLFDVNDFDETLPGPFEYDVKRMAASFTIVGRNNGFAKADTRAATLASVRAYREAMASFAQWARWTSGTPTWTRTSSWPRSAARWPGCLRQRQPLGSGAPAGLDLVRLAGDRGATGPGAGQPDPAALTGGQAAEHVLGGVVLGGVHQLPGHWRADKN